MARRGTPFAGVLYCGLALTSRGVRVIEFNARFGDPETQVVLARLGTPLGGAAARRRHRAARRAAPLRWRDGAAVTVVVAAHGLPGHAATGDVITGLAVAAASTARWVLHAGTALDADGPGGLGRRPGAVGGRDRRRPGRGPRRGLRGGRPDRLAGGHHRTDIAATAGRRRVPTGREESAA